MGEGDSCDVHGAHGPHNMSRDGHTDDEIREILSAYKTVAVIGMSREEGKESHDIPKYLMITGYNVIPVNPNAEYILGRKSYKSVSEVPVELDIIDIFRPSDKVYPAVKEALVKNPKVIWMQEGIYNEEARKLAESKGIAVVFNRCMMKEHIRLFGK